MLPDVPEHAKRGPQGRAGGYGGLVPRCGVEFLERRSPLRIAQAPASPPWLWIHTICWDSIHRPLAQDVQGWPPDRERPKSVDESKVVSQKTVDGARYALAGKTIGGSPMKTTTKHPRPHRLSLVGLATLVCAAQAGCGKKSRTLTDDSGITATDAQGDATPPGADPTADGGTSGAVTCSTVSDCTAEGACPPDAVMGCTCVAVPTGRTCLPMCFATSDCPKLMDQPLACSAAGLCIPEDQITLDAGHRTRPLVPDAKRTSDADDAKPAGPDGTSPPMAEDAPADFADALR